MSILHGQTNTCSCWSSRWSQTLSAFLVVEKCVRYFRLRTERIEIWLSLCRCRFPHLFCSSIVIETLMNIINILSYSLNEDNLHKVTAHHRVPDTNYTIQFVDTHEKRLVRWLNWNENQRRMMSLHRNCTIPLSISVECLLNKRWWCLQLFSNLVFK